MSTRANIILTETSFFGGEKYTETMYFYRHSDGYPKGTLPLLNKFMDWLRNDKIRNNCSQAAGWLIILGAIEYNTIPKFQTEKPRWENARCYGDFATLENPDDWKAGAIEPTDQIHGDIEYLYVINLSAKTLKCYDKWTKAGKGTHEVDLTKVLEPEKENAELPL